jgi:hypothetical protein
LEAASKTSFCLILNDLDLDSFELQQDYTVNVNLTYLPSGDTTGYIPENYDFKFGAVNMDRGNYVFFNLFLYLHKLGVQLFFQYYSKSLFDSMI